MFQKDLVYTNQCKSTLSKNDRNDPEKDITYIESDVITSKKLNEWI